MPAFCRVTGRSRGLPRPNYFPLIPPISPADAKRLCRITGKANSTPYPHNYTPILLVLGHQTLNTCSITHGHPEGQTPATATLPISRTPITERAKKGRFKVLCPHLDPGEGSLAGVSKWVRDILESRSGHFGGHSEHSGHSGGHSEHSGIEINHFAYFVDVEKTLLLLPQTMEGALEKGQVEGLALAKDGQGLSVKLTGPGGYESLTLPLHVTTLKKLEEWELQGCLRSGSGPPASVLEKAKKQQVVKVRTVSSTSAGLCGLRASLFKAKEEQAEIAELKSLEKITPSAQKVQKVQTRLEKGLKGEPILGGIQVPEIKTPGLEKRARSSGSKRADSKAHLGLDTKFGADERTAAAARGGEFGAMVQFAVDGSVRFFEEKSIPREFVKGRSSEVKKVIPGRLVENQDGSGGKTFIPGKIIRRKGAPEGEGNFVPGQIVKTNKGEKFVPGIVLSDSKFVPGQFISLNLGAGAGDGDADGDIRFVPGQVMVDQDGSSRFCPGQIIETETGSHFIPGQVVWTSEGSKFLPGQVIEEEGQVKFIPGHVVEDKGQIRFIPGTVVQTEEGLHFVAPDLRTSENGFEFTLQTYELSGAEEAAVCQSQPQDQADDERLLQPPRGLERQRSTSSVLLFRQESVQPLTHAELREAFRRQHSSSNIIEPATLQALNDAGVILEGSSLILPSVQVELSGQIEDSTITTTRSEPSIDPHHNILQLLTEALGHNKSTNSQKDLEDMILGQGQDHEQIIAKLSHILQQKEPSSSQAPSGEPGESSQLLGQILSELKGQEKGLENLLQKGESFTRRQRVPSDHQEDQDQNNEEMEIEIGGFSAETLELLVQAVGLAQLMGRSEVARELGAVLDDAEHLRLLADDPEVLFILRQLQVMRRLAGDDPRKLEKILTLPSAVLETGPEDPVLAELLWKSSLLTEFVLPLDQRGRTVEKMEEEPLDHSSLLVGKIEGETARILSGDSEYTVVEEAGVVRFFEPATSRHEAVALKSFSQDFAQFLQEPCQKSPQSSISHDVQITEVDDDTTDDEVSNSKRIRLAEFESVGRGGEMLEFSGAKHKMAVRPSRRRPTSPRHHRGDKGAGKEANPAHDREAAIGELLETEEEFVRDLKGVVERYHDHLDDPSVPRHLAELRDPLFSAIKKIHEFHSTVLLEGIKYYAHQPKMIGRTFLRLERDFDKHVAYCRDEPLTQEFLEKNPQVKDYFDEYSGRIGDEKTLSEHLQLPVQRINDYQVLLRDLVASSAALGEDTTDLSNALELMLAIPHKQDDLKFLNSIEGYRGNIAKLGRLLKHDWFSVTNESSGPSRDRYIFLFKSRLLVTKVRRISEDRSIFILKEILKLPELELEELDEKSFRLSGPGGEVRLESQSGEVKEAWLKEIRLYAHDKAALAEHGADDLQLEPQHHRATSEELLDHSQSSQRTPTPNLSQNQSQNQNQITAELPKEPAGKILKEPLKESNQNQNQITAESPKDSAGKGSIKDSVKEPNQSQNQNQITPESSKEPAGKGKGPLKEAVKEPALPTTPDTTTPIQKPTKSLEKQKEKLPEVQQKAEPETKSKVEEPSPPPSGPVGSQARRKSSIVLRAADLNSANMEQNEELRPKFKKTIKALECEPGEKAEFQCEVVVEGAASVAWLKENRPLDDRLADRVKITAVGGKHTLRLLNCRNEDSGLYTAKVTSENGSSVSCSARLTVHEMSPEERKQKAAESMPCFLVRLKDTELLEETTVSFVLQARGDPPPKLAITLDGKPLVESDRIRLNREHADKGSYELTIEHITPADAGLYKAIASNSHGSAECEAQVSVSNEKVLFAGCTKNLLEPGEEPSFTWFRDGVEFDPEDRFKVMFKDDEDSLALVFQHVKPDDAGLYTCVGSTSSGRMSCSAELTVQGAVSFLLREPEPPAILVELTDTEVSVGGSAMMELRVGGYPKPGAIMTKDGVEVVAGGRFRFLYEDDESIALIIKGVTTADAGTYKVVASNELGEAETTGILYVKCPPKFRTKMVDMACMTDAPFRMDVEVEGTPTPEVKFYKNGQLLLESERIKIVQESGEKFSIYFERVTLEDSGAYSVVASNQIGQMSEFWNLIAQMPAKIVEKLESRVEIEEKESVTFTIKTQGTPDPQVKWSMNGEVLSSSQKMTMVSESGSHTLTMKEVSRSGSGKISVSASNQFGEDTSSGELLVKRAPKVTQGLTGVSAKAGDSAEFSVKVDAHPLPKVKWFLDGIEIDGKAYDKSVDESSGTFKLKIKNVESSGTVKVKLENQYGSDESSASLTVKSKPVIKEGLTDMRVVEKEKLELKVRIEGTEPEVKWLHNGSEVSADARIKITRESTETYHCSLTVILPSDGGTWEVQASNELGSASSSCQITVEGVPRFEKRLKETVEVIESEELVVEVIVGAEPKPTIKWMLGNKELTLSERVTITTDTQSSTSLTKSVLRLSSVLLEEAGQLIVTAENKHGSADSKSTIKVQSSAELKKPRISVELSDTSAKTGQPVVLEAVVGGQAPTIKWTKEGLEIKPDGHLKLVAGLDGKQRLEIKDCTPADAAAYSISATNEWGEAQSSARVDVLFKPEIVGLKDIFVGPGEEGVFEAKVSANPPAKAHWMKGKEVLKESKKVVITNHPEKGVYHLSVRVEDRADEDTYTLKASNEIGESTTSAKLHMQSEPPQFLKPLSAVQLKDREPLELKVRVSGSPAPTITFTKDGRPLGSNAELVSDAEKGTHTLTIPKMSPADFGKYEAKAKNAAGEAETSSLVKMVQTAPTFGHLLDKRRSFDEGEPLELKAKVDGSPFPTVQWLKDGKPIVPSERVKISQLPDGTCILRIDKCEKGDTGAYSLSATNPNGENVTTCAAEVTCPPKVPTFDEPLSGPTTVKAGEPLRLTAKVSGWPKPTLRFLKDGRPLRAGVHVAEKGDGRVTLEVEAAQLADGGKYSLLLTSEKGEAAQEVQVTVLAPPTRPKISEGLQDVKVVEGTPVQLQTAFIGNPPPTIKWLKDGKPIDLETKILERPDGSKVAQVCFTAGPADAGTYTMVASNPEGSTETKAQVGVLSKSTGGEPATPSFLSELADVEVDEGGELHLGAKVAGNPLPDLSWTRDGEPLGPEAKISFDGTRVGLNLPGVRPSDAGVYELTLSNPSGSLSSNCRVGVRKVFQAPTFTSRFTNSQQVPGQDYKFVGRIGGIPSPDVSWTFDGRPVEESAKYRLRRDGDTVSLMVRDCDRKDAGRYSCILQNREGTDKCEAQLDIVDKIEKRERTEAPYFLKKIGDCEVYEGMTAKWTACVGGTPEPECEGAGLLRLMVKGVVASDVGRYRLKIFNPHGDAWCDGLLNYDTLDTRPKRPVGDQYMGFDKFRDSGLPTPLADRPIISRMTDRHLTLSWKPSIPHGGPRPPVTYQVEMCECPDGEWFCVRKGIRSCACDIRNLEPHRDYRFRVRVENQYGLSDPSPYAQTLRSRLDLAPPAWRPPMHHSIPRDYDLDRPPHEGYTHVPRFLNQEHDTQYAVLGLSATVYWWVYGYPKPQIDFEFNSIGQKFDHDYARSGQISLFLSRMTRDHVGMFEAIATNVHGQARQRVKLAIAEYPRFLQRPEETYIMARKGGKLTAVVTGIPEPEFKWFKDWQPLGASNRIKMNVGMTDEDVYTVTLTINDTIMKDEGLYSLVCTNVAGSIHSSVTIHIEESELDYDWLSYNGGRDVKRRNRDLTDAYDLGDELGRGTQGITRHVVERATGRSYAGKFMRGSGHKKAWMETEYSLQNALNHRNLTRIVDAFERHDGWDLVTELSSGGELLDSITRQDYLTESTIAHWIRQVLWGIEHLHNRNIAHLGLTPGDLLVSRPDGDELRISDFGLSRRIMTRLSPLEYGMPEFVAPEIVGGKDVSYPADLWSIGIITYLLVGGTTPFRGENDRETLQNIQGGNWAFNEYFEYLSADGRDFISKLIVASPECRMSVSAALRHPWLKWADRIVSDAHQFRLDSHRRYYSLLKDWYSNASCRDTYRRRPLSGAFSHPSKMVYPPNYVDTPERRPSPTREPRAFTPTDSHYPRPDLNYDIDVQKSESHYQNGPDTYLLQLRDADFPARLRQYMKVAAHRSPALALQLKGSAYDRNHTVIRERRRFTDVMDEEIDDERKHRIAKYGEGPWNSEPRRLRHEIGTRMEAQVEAEAMLSMRRDGSGPIFREKPAFSLSVELDKPLELVAVVAGDPMPLIQWFKNDLVVGENSRIRVTTEENGSVSRLTFDSLVAQYDMGPYKIVARNKNGQTTARFRLVYAGDEGSTPIEPPHFLNTSCEANPMEVETTGRFTDYEFGREISTGSRSVTAGAKHGSTQSQYTVKIIADSDEAKKELANLKGLRHVRLANLVTAFPLDELTFVVKEAGGTDVLRLLSNTHQFSEQNLAHIISQILDGLQYLHWRGLALLNLEPGNVLVDSVENPHVRLADLSNAQPVSRLGSIVNGGDTALEYTSPEVLNEEPALPQSDLWSLGVLVYVLLSGVSPFKGSSTDETRQNILYVRFRFEHLFKEITQEATRFIMLLFKRAPLKRPTVEEAFEHRWLLPSEFMFKKRQRAHFLGHRLRAVCEDYHNGRARGNARKGALLKRFAIEEVSLGPSEADLLQMAMAKTPAHTTTGPQLNGVK